ncbi:hypothetical protein MASR1M66_04210 [Aminivibrio sp.]
MMAVEKNGKSILIANVNGEYYAMGNICTHRGCSLSDGTLEGDKDSVRAMPPGSM